MCSHDSKHTFKEAFIGPARCGLPFLNMPAGPFLPNLGPKSLFPISGLCSSDRPAPCKGLSLAKLGDTQSRAPLSTSCLLSMPLITIMFPVDTASNKSEQGDSSNSLGPYRPLTKVKTWGAEYQHECHILV